MYIYLKIIALKIELNHDEEPFLFLLRHQLLMLLIHFECNSVDVDLDLDLNCSKIKNTSTNK